MKENVADILIEALPYIRKFNPGDIIAENTNMVQRGRQWDHT